MKCAYCHKRIWFWQKKFYTWKMKSVMKYNGKAEYVVLHTVEKRFGELRGYDNVYHKPCFLSFGRAMNCRVCGKPISEPPFNYGISSFGEYYGIHDNCQTKLLSEQINHIEKNGWKED